MLKLSPKRWLAIREWVSIALLLAITLLFPSTALSLGACAGFFPEALQTNGVAGTDKVTFACNAAVNSNPDNILNTIGVTNPAGACEPTCNTANCTSTGTQTATINTPTFQASGSSTDQTIAANTTLGPATVNYRTVVVNTGITLAFDGTAPTYKITTLTLNANSVVNFAPGDYWINTLNVNGAGVQFNATGSGTVRVYVNTTTSITQNIQVNAGGSAKNFLMYGFANLTLNAANITFVGVAYSQATLTFGSGVTVTGAGTGKGVSVTGQVTYDGSAGTGVNGMTFGAICASDAVCRASFAHGLQSTGTGTNAANRVTFNCGGKLLSDPNNILPSTVVNNPSSTCTLTCTSTQNCAGNSSPLGTITVGAFQTTPSVTDVTVAASGTATLGGGGIKENRTVTVGNSGTLNFTDYSGSSGNTYKITTLSLAAGATVNFLPGDYWIGTLTTTGNGPNLQVSGSGTARLYINNAVSSTRPHNINTTAGSNPAKRMFIYAYNSVSLTDTANVINAVIHSPNAVTLATTTAISGAVNAKNISLNAGTTITYDGTAVSQMDFGVLCPSTSVATYFVQTYSSNGINCSPQSVTVTARNGSGVATTYNHTIVLDTQSAKGTWSLASGGGSFLQATPDNGVATYTFVAGDGGVASFNLNYSNGPTPITIKTYEQGSPSIQDDGTAGSINFYPSGFVLTGTVVPNPPIGSVASYADTQTAGDSDTVYIAAYGQTAFDPTCGVIETYTGNKLLKFWSQYVDPATGTIAATIDGSGIATTEAGSISQTVTFTNGQASVSARYRDVGSIRLFTKDDTVPLPVGGITGSTANFVVKPAQFVVTITGNPGATSATDPVFVKAGNAFTAQVQAKDSAGNNTPNYGNESTPASVTLQSSTVVLPAGGRNGSANNGAVANGSSLTKIGAGLFQGTNLSFDEVGIFKFTASVNGSNYLGAGNVAGPETGNVGRFIPDNFNVTSNTPSVTTGCAAGTFTYFDKPFVYGTKPTATVTARSLAGTTTQNYTGSFWRLLTSSLGQVYATNSSSTLSATAALADLVFTDNANGTGTYVFGDGGGMALLRTATPVSPVTLEMKLSASFTDQDAVTFSGNPFSFGGITTGTGIAFSAGKEFRYGRFNLVNVVGPEISPLTMATVTEYFGMVDFQINTQDSCTVFNNAAWVNLTLPSGLTTTVSGVTAIASGVGGITLSTPTPSGARGTVSVEANLGAAAANLPWLQYDWPYDDNSDGVLDDNPEGTADFGLYERGTQFIFEQEQFQ